MVIDERGGSAELELLAERLITPCRIGEYVVEGLIRKTSTALIFVARGGAFGSSEGVLKLTGEHFAPLLERELGFLNICRSSDIGGVVRPVRAELEWFQLEGPEPSFVRLAAIALPFLSGGDLVQLTSTRVGPSLAVQVGEHVAPILRSLLRLARPFVHGDIKPQNLLLPIPGAPLSDLTLIDFDASQELEVDVDHLVSLSAEQSRRLVGDVNGFGELLYVLSTGHEPPADGEPDPTTDNAALNSLVVKCMSSDVGAAGSGYASMADNELWRDLAGALAAERRRTPAHPVLQFLVSRASLAALGLALFVALLAAIVSKFIPA